MNEGQLANRMSAENELTTRQSEKALDGPIDVIHTELSSRGTISLIGLGVFHVTDRKSRMARSPETGEEIEVKAKKILVFKAGSNLGQAVNSR